MKARLLHYSEFADDLDQASPLKIAASRSKALRQKKFFVYRGNIRRQKILLNLDFLPASSWDASMVVYPVIFGDIVADELYFHGCVEGNITARNLYCERFSRVSIPSGCTKNLNVAQLCYVHADCLMAGAAACIATAVLVRDAEIVSPASDIAHQFVFASQGWGVDWSKHTLDEIKHHFNDRVIDELDRLTMYYGQSVDAMIPIMPSILDKHMHQWLRNPVK